MTKSRPGPERGWKQHEYPYYWEQDPLGTSSYSKREREEGSYCDGKTERIYARRRNDKDKWQFIPIGYRCLKCGEFILDEES